MFVWIHDEIVEGFLFWNIYKGVLLFTGVSNIWVWYDCIESSYCKWRVAACKDIVTIFLSFASHLWKISCESHVYARVSDLLNLTSLAECRRLVGINFITGPLSNKVDSFVLISILRFFSTLLGQLFPSLFLIPPPTTYAMNLLGG